jgi:CDP-diacylglycerol--serine O-phosphatidyltransferase
MSEPTPTDRPRRNNAIYLLPNLFTTGALFAGYYAIVASINQRFVEAAVAVFIAGLLDGLDGRIARLTNTQSEFGVQYDSLSDLVSFGLAPSLIMYNWSLVTLKSLGPFWGKLGWLIAFLYAACAALRLARFNTQVGSADKRYFVGLASPAAAGTLVSFIWAAESYGLNGTDLRWVTLVLTAVVALLMVSRVRYYSFKSWPERIPFYWLLALVLVIAALALEPASTLLAVMWLYALSGMLLWLWSKLRRSQRPAPVLEQASTDDKDR